MPNQARNDLTVGILLGSAKPKQVRGVVASIIETMPIAG